MPASTCWRSKDNSGDSALFSYSGKQRAHSVRPPRLAICRRKVSLRQDLPTPASPRSNQPPPWPWRACRQPRNTWRSSRARPMQRVCQESEPAATSMGCKVWAKSLKQPTVADADGTRTRPAGSNSARPRSSWRYASLAQISPGPAWLSICRAILRVLPGETSPSAATTMPACRPMRTSNSAPARRKAASPWRSRASNASSTAMLAASRASPSVLRG